MQFREREQPGEFETSRRLLYTIGTVIVVDVAPDWKTFSKESSSSSSSYRRGTGGEGRKEIAAREAAEAATISEKSCSLSLSASRDSGR